MKTKEEALYVGGAIEIQRDGKPPFIKVDLDMTELERKLDMAAHSRTISFRDGPHSLISLIVAPMKQENQKPYKTHSVKIDTWKPIKKQELTPDEDLPF